MRSKLKIYSKYILDSYKYQESQPIESDGDFQVAKSNPSTE